MTQEELKEISDFYYKDKMKEIINIKKHYLKVLKNAKNENKSYKFIYEMFVVGLESDVDILEKMLKEKEN